MFVKTTLIVVCTALAFPVLGQNRGVIFPVQKSDPADSRTFFRIRADNGDIEKLTCPDGFSFDTGEMKCAFDNESTKKAENATQICPSNFRGTLPNPRNCRTFFNCWDGYGYEMECSAHLLYNGGSSACDWPEEAGCCEYWEKDPNQIVQ